MHRYADTPMDFADATLVVLAGELETKQVLTLDERGFRTYRYGRNAAFHLVLQDGPKDARRASLQADHSPCSGASAIASGCFHCVPIVALSRRMAAQGLPMK